MRIIALANGKGGVGKSTTCINLACQAMAEGYSAAIVDMDFPQKSATEWAERRELPEPRVLATQSQNLDATLKSLKREKVDWCFLDLPGRSAPVTSAGMKAAHFILVPSRPAEIDLNGTRDVLNAVFRLKRPYAFLISDAPPLKTGRAREVADSLRDRDYVVADIVIQHRLAVVDAVGLGRAVVETEPKGAAAAEYAALFAWLQKQF